MKLLKALAVLALSQSGANAKPGGKKPKRHPMEMPCNDFAAVENCSCEDFTLKTKEFDNVSKVCKRKGGALSCTCAVYG